MYAFAAACAIGLAMPSHSLAQFARQEVIAFKTDNLSPVDFLSGKKGASVNLAGFLRLPKAGPEKQPVVIVLHGAGGLHGADGFSTVWSNVLNEAGIATFAVDGFAGRGVNTQADVAKLSPVTRISEAFAALAVLAEHPLIDAKKIVVMGLSHGSVAALYSNLERFQKMYGAPGVQFAAHISMYGICGTRYREDEKLVRPLLMLHGTADDFVPIGPCREYAERLVKAGNKISLIEYQDAHHAFDAPTFPKVIHFAKRATPSWCRFAESDDGFVNTETQKALTPTDACWKTGVSVGYNEAAAKKSYADVIAFLNGVFGQ
jgi:dienelactone hydrolase